MYDHEQQKKPPRREPSPPRTPTCPSSSRPWNSGTAFSKTYFLSLSPEHSCHLANQNPAPLWPFQAGKSCSWCCLQTILPSSPKLPSKIPIRVDGSLPCRVRHLLIQITAHFMILAPGSLPLRLLFSTFLVISTSR